MGASGGAFSYLLISEVCGGQMPPRPREIQIPESLHTLVIGVCGIFMLIGRGGCAWKNGSAAETQRRGENFRAEAFTAEARRARQRLGGSPSPPHKKKK